MSVTLQLHHQLLIQILQVDTTLDTGQRDNFYDIGRIVRKQGELNLQDRY